MNALIRRRWINLGLLGLASGLAALALLEPGRKQTGVISPLLELAPARIERIEVLRIDRETLIFVRRDSRWRMTAPDSGWANPVLIHRILEVATVRCSRQYPAAELDASALHLESPRVWLRLDDREIRFGATTPTDGLRYLQVGATVHLCPDRLYPLLTSAAAGFLTSAIESPESLATKVE